MIDILAESQSCVKYAFMQIFLRGHSLCHGCEDVPWTWITLSTLSKIWKMREEEIKFLLHKSWRTEKVIGKKYQSGPIALPSCRVMSGKQIVTQAVRPMYPINGVPVLLCIWGQFSSTSPPPPGAYIRRGEITQGFLRNEFGGFIFGGAYTWRGLSSEFYGMLYYSELSHRI